VTKPYYADEHVTIYHGDAFDLLHDLSGIDAVITDPPYSSGGAFRGDRAQQTTIKYVNSDTIAYRPDFAGDNRDQRSFLAWSTLWLNAARKATQPGAVLCSFIDWRQLPTMTDAVQAGGWTWRGVAVWDKTLKSRPAAGQFTSQAEYVVWGTNGPAIRRELGRQIPGVFPCAAPESKHRDHIAQKPIDVMRWVLQVVPPRSTVLDPFMGSGATLRAAKDLGHRVVGIDVDERYCAVAVQRLRQEAFNFGAVV
jgi:site-specific DNA-methyltransferase (adenine-specific)